MSDLPLPPWAVVTPRRRDHIARVVAQVELWAAALGASPAERARWRRAALLHDALRDADAATLARYAPQEAWPPQVWHGPAAAAAAEQGGEQDRGVLDAIRYHTVGYAEWDDAGRMLYLADWLEPGRAHDRAVRDALADLAGRDPAAALRDVAARRLQWSITAGQPIHPHTWAFWNRLVASG